MTTGQKLSLMRKVVTQAHRDLVSSRADRRSEAETFWQTPASVAFWAELLDTTPARLRDLLARQTP